MEGDQLIPLASALLPGAPSLVLDRAAHGQGFGRPWYGSHGLLDQLWPIALETWRTALRARVERGQTVAADADDPVDR